MVNSRDREICKILAEKFYKEAGSGLGKGNQYDITILEPRFEELTEKVKDTYPEYYQAFSNAKEEFFNQYKSYYNSNENKKTAVNQGAVQSK